MTDIEVVELGSGHIVVLTYEPRDRLDDAEIVSVSDVTLPPGSGVPIGPAGGVLSGNYPNPGFAEPMASRADVDAKLAAHVLDPAPHPAYDDIPDLTLWYRNALI